MRNSAYISILLFFCLHISYSQPFELDPKINPIKLELQENKQQKGEKGIATLGTVKDTSKYYFVKGHSMFQLIDVFIFGHGNKDPLEAKLVKHTWEDLADKQSTKSAKNGIIHFKLRSYGDFGIEVSSISGEQINYSIIVKAGEPIKEHLGDPFRKIKETEVSASITGGASGNTREGNTLLYILLGIALLVIGLLAGKLMGKKSTMVLLILFGTTFSLLAQPPAGTTGFYADGQYFNPQDLDNGKFEDAIREQSGYDPTSDINNVREFINSGRDRVDAGINLYNEYMALGDCMTSAPLPNSPRVPSFCDAENEDDECSSCFLSAREEFNRTRYLLEELRTIYNCTKSFSGKAISFGDNVSGIHGVSGLVWQEQRRGIEKSLSDLEAAYDQKYIELINRLKESMIELGKCESQFGIEDWFDRFGYMYFEFMASAYKRSN